MSVQTEIPPDAPAPRLSHLIKWADFDGYGFNLHAEKSRTGQFIGKVDDDSPAQHAGLREGDRIIEVNGVNIANENHRQVVERIKSIPNETKLLVIDEEADRWYKEKKIVVKSTQANVISMKTPVPRPSKEPPCYVNISPSENGTDRNSTYGNGVHDNKNSSSGLEKYEETRNGSASNGVVEEKVDPPREVQPSPKAPKVVKNIVPDSPTPTKKEEVQANSRSSTPPTAGSTGSSPGSAARVAHQNGGGGLNLDMSASEMRQMLAARRKRDPKKEQMDIRQKYDIIQQM